jgi:trehalose synthase
MKDMRGVMLAFAGHMEKDSHLLLVGPDVGGVADDPEAAAILDECLATWKMLAPGTRARVHLACLPMHDTDANSLMTNAIQRGATVVTQKSLAEGFGLTVAESMWKQRPLVASRVGGIPDQIVHGVHGLLLDDPRDLATFAAEVTRLLEDRRLSERLGTQAHRRASEELLGDRHLERWGALFAAILP